MSFSRTAHMMRQKNFLNKLFMFLQVLLMDKVRLKQLSYFIKFYKNVFSSDRQTKIERVNRNFMV